MRKLSLIMIIMIFVTLNASDFGKVVDIFEDYIKDYKRADSRLPEVVKVKEELRNLAVYRLYKIQMVGSLEKRELSLTTSDFMTKLYDVYAPEDLQKRIAFSAFLAYLASELSGHRTTLSSIMKLPAFSKSFDLYRQLVRKKFYNLFIHDVAYLLGIVETPYIEGLQGKKVADLDMGGVPLPEVRSLSFEDPLGFVNSDFLKLMVQRTKELKERISQREIEPRRILAELRRVSLSLINERTGQMQNEIANQLVSVIPKRINLWWIKWLIYAGLIVLVVRKRKLYKILIPSMLTFEGVYILVFMDPFFSRLDAYIYGVSVLPVFIFSALLFLPRVFKKFDWVHSILIATIFVVLLGFFVPLYDGAAELRMDAFPTFHDSVYYEMLKEDVFLGDIAQVRRDMVSLRSTVAKEVNQTRGVVRKTEKFFNDLIEEGAVKSVRKIGTTYRLLLPTFSEFYDTINAQNYRDRFASFANFLSSFNVESRSRLKEVRRTYAKLENAFSKIIRYGDEKFRTDLWNYVDRNLRKQAYTASYGKMLMEEMEELRNVEPEPAKIRVFQIRHGIIMLLGLMVGTSFLVILKSRMSVIFYVVSLVAALWSMFTWKHLRIFVQFGIPLLEVKVSEGYVWFFPVMVMIVSIFTIVTSLLLRRRLTV